MLQGEPTPAPGPETGGKSGYQAVPQDAGEAPPALRSPYSGDPWGTPPPDAPMAGPAPAQGALSQTQLPPDLWRGLDAAELEKLLARTPLPSPSPALAKLIAGALAAGTPASDRERKVREAALKRAGSVEALAELLRAPVDSLASGSGGAGGKASPVDLFFLAQDEAEDAELRLAAAERAAALNVIDGGALGRAYREVAPKLGKSAKTPATLRAKLFASLDAQESAATRAESIDALLASGKDAGIEVAIAEALAPASADLAQAPDAQSFAETGIRVAALAGEDEAAWAWVNTGGGRVQSWQLLLGAIEPSGTRARAALDGGVEIATRAKLPGPVLQRVVTVLDALGEDVPIPLWDLASRSPEPQDGYLPETGVLSALKEASDQGETGRTILLAAIALGPKGPQDAHLIALGDTLRALKRVGLDAEARRIALEALIRHWPSHGKA